MSEGSPGRPLLRAVPRPLRIALVAVLAALVSAYATGNLGLEAETRAHPGLTEYLDHQRGFSVEYPDSWERADAPMFPSIINPRSILAVSTFAIPRGNDRSECGFFPSRVRAAAGRSGAAVLVFESYVSSGGDRKLRQRTPGRPPSFRLDEAHGLPTAYFETQGDQRSPGAEAEEWLYPFRDVGRILTAAVVLGPKASSERRREVMAVLDSLRFDPALGVDTR